MNQNQIQTLVREIWNKTVSSEDSKNSVELRWLKENIKRFAEQNHLQKKQDIDAALYEKMYGQPSDSDTQLLKIRYWRTGLHRPQRREECLRLGHALDLSEQEMLYLLQYYYDAADVTFLEFSSDNALHQTRRLHLDRLAEQYIWNALPDKLIRFQISLQNPSKYLRHYFYQDALEYTGSFSKLNGQVHLESANFGGEFKKTMALIGEVSRGTILRLLLIMNAPFLSTASINRQLILLGFAPLTKGHYNRSGAPVDDLILELLKIYETHCSDLSPLEASNSIRQMAQELDRLALENCRSDLRIFHFKSMR